MTDTTTQQPADATANGQKRKRRYVTGHDVIIPKSEARALLAELKKIGQLDPHLQGLFTHLRIELEDDELPESKGNGQNQQQSDTKAKGRADAFEQAQFTYRRNGKSITVDAAFATEIADMIAMGDEVIDMLDSPAGVDGELKAASCWQPIWLASAEEWVDRNKFRDNEQYRLDVLKQVVAINPPPAPRDDTLAEYKKHLAIYLFFARDGDRYGLDEGEDGEDGTPAWRRFGNRIRKLRRGAELASVEESPKRRRTKAEGQS